MLSSWDELPPLLRTEEVRPYWEYLNARRPQLALKRCFDVAVSAVGLTALGLPMLAVKLMTGLARCGAWLGELTN